MAQPYQRVAAGTSFASASQATSILHLFAFNIHPENALPCGMPYGAFARRIDLQPGKGAADDGYVYVFCHALRSSYHRFNKDRSSAVFGSENRGRILHLPAYFADNTNSDSPCSVCFGCCHCWLLLKASVNSSGKVRRGASKVIKFCTKAKGRQCRLGCYMQNDDCQRRCRSYGHQNAHHIGNAILPGFFGMGIMPHSGMQVQPSVRRCAIPEQTLHLPAKASASMRFSIS